MGIDQKHLNYKETINLGSYYTPDTVVDLVYSIVEKRVKNIIKLILI